MPDSVDPHLQQLRTRAEQRLRELNHSADFAGERAEILQELHIYQAELEIQNQQLRETQEQLQKALDRANALYHQSPIGFVTIDAQGKIQEINESFAIMLGYEIGQLRMKFLADFCQPESAAILRQRLAAFFKKPEDKILDLAMITAGNRQIMVEVAGRHIPGENFLACSVVDRTRRKEAEEERRDTEAQLRAITAAARNPIIMINSHGLVTYSNPACQRVLGYNPQQLLGRNIHQFLADKTKLHDIEQQLRDFQKTGRADVIGRTVELLARHQSGRLLNIELSLSSVSVKGEWHAIGIIQDITQSKKREQEAIMNGDRLKHWHHLMSYIIHHDPNAIAVLDRNLHFLFVSDRFLQDYGVARKSVIGKHHYEVFPGIPERWRTVHQRALAGEILSNNEDIFHREKGEIDYTRWQCRPWYDIDGTIGGIILYTELITERKMMELALADRTRELEERTAELERFNYTVSHDLKSPLVTIRTFLGFLEQDIRDQQQDKIAEDIEHMRTAADRMDQLLEDLLSLSRLGWVAEQPETVSLKDFLEHTLVLLQGRIRAHNTQVSMVDCDAHLHMDPTLLIEIWQNLIDNALKYGNSDGSTTTIEIGTEPGPETIFYILDHGPGIAPKYHDKIFGLFEKLDRSSEGSGLGLVLVKRIVEKHGGSIWVESPGNGQGCCFKFTLPAACGNQSTREN